jgi:hypothetical protein
MRVEEELVFWFHVIEESHLSVTHDNEPLLLVRMEPAYKDMRSDAGGEGQSAERDISDLLVQIIGSHACNMIWHFTCQSENHGDVMGSKAPKDIFLSPDLAQI